jgi:hypothetical protein
VKARHATHLLPGGQAAAKFPRPATSPARM